MYVRNHRCFSSTWSIKHEGADGRGSQGGGGGILFGMRGSEFQEKAFVREEAGKTAEPATSFCHDQLGA